VTRGGRAALRHAIAERPRRRRPGGADAGGSAPALGDPPAQAGEPALRGLRGI